MKTFKQYLVEAIEDDRGVLGRIDNLTNASEITKREFEELKYDFNRYIEKLSKPFKEKYLYGKGGELNDIDDRLGDLAWNIPTSYIEIASMKNRLKKASGLSHPIVVELQAFYDQYIGYVEKFKALKDKIVLASAKLKKKYQENYKQAAHDSFIGWIEKMIDKIGAPVIKAESHGDPWRGSTLRVTTKDGEEQVWDTQMIINRSKYNELFNQFPSRRKK